MADELTSKSATELTHLIRAGAVSSVEVVAAYLQRIGQINPELNAIVTIAPDLLERARARDAELMSGMLVGPLHGLPITIKDTIDTEGIRTTYGSRLFTENVPQEDAAVVARLKAAGAIILGKTNVPEMAVPYETNNLIFGRSNNPHNRDYTPGGSSGGEAAAVAARLSPAGIGSDLSGSIRVPAHFCGVAGLKPTTGAVSMQGHLPRATGSLALGAAIGPMARCVDDLALLFSVMSNAPAEAPLSDNDRNYKRVSWYCDDGVAPVAQEIREGVQAAAEMLRAEGYDVCHEIPPGFSEGQRLWIEVFSHDAGEQIREMYRGRGHEAGPLISRLLTSANETTLEGKSRAEVVKDAVVERERWREELLRWMKTTPLIIAPVSSTAAFAQGADRVEVDGESISIFRSCSYSQTVNVFGLPAVVVPVARTAEGLPFGVQIIARPFKESEALAAAAIIEQSAGF